MTDENPNEGLLDQLTILLDEPVSFGNGKSKLTLTELKLREPTAGELDDFFKAQAKQAGVGAFIPLIAKMSDSQEQLVRRVPSSKLKEAMRFLLPFVSLEDVFQPTGETSSLS